MVDCLEKRIVGHKRTDVPRYGMTAAGYTKRAGAPTCSMILLEGEKRFRRVMVWQFSNVGTLFVNVGGRPLVVREYEIPDAA